MTDLASSAPHIHAASHYEDLRDWGAQPEPLAGASHSTGRLLFKGPGNVPETGIWVCTPGRWRICVPRDEFCHFVAGRARYTATTGEVTEVRAGTCVLFPAGYAGEAEVIETIRNIYMLA
ncbi:cupin domain-containing protein [Rhodobacter lacus]|uniref:Cupin domain-containing protein n=1 Tax=Rhodobacter lacus TaxID=1641972 RepID=A0ABW5A8V7_9RHOB